jgi:hypothetical protein
MDPGTSLASGTTTCLLLRGCHEVGHTEKPSNKQTSPRGSSTSTAWAMQCTSRGIAPASRIAPASNRNRACHKDLNKLTPAAQEPAPSAEHTALAEGTRHSGKDIANANAPALIPYCGLADVADHGRHFSGIAHRSKHSKILQEHASSAQRRPRQAHRYERTPRDGRSDTLSSVATRLTKIDRASAAALVHCACTSCA